MEFALGQKAYWCEIHRARIADWKNVIYGPKEVLATRITFSNRYPPLLEYKFYNEGEEIWHRSNFLFGSYAEAFRSLKNSNYLIVAEDESLSHFDILERTA